jgi:hypothetical protein
MSEHKHEWRIDYRDGGAWCGLDCPAQITSAEVGRRLNAHDPLLAACKEALIGIACHCDEAYAARGRHEPNSLCYLEDDLRAAIVVAEVTG